MGELFSSFFEAGSQRRAELSGDKDKKDTYTLCTALVAGDMFK